MNQKIGLLKRVKPLLPLDAQITLYNTLISPLFDYADVIWGDKDNTTLMGDLQNKAAKVILDLPGYASSIDALKSLGWPTLSQRRLVNRYMITFKYIHGLVDYNFNILKNSDIHSYNTWRKNDFRLPRVRTNYGKKTLLYQGIKERNLLEQSFKDINSFLIFKQRIKERVFS